MAVTAGLSLLTLLALRVAAQHQLIHFEVGGSLRLNPEFSEAITSITWTHYGNIVAEYIKNAVPLEYLGDFKGRANLDLTTGILTISNMRKSDDGHFTVEINNRVIPVSFTAVGIRRLDDYPVEVSVRPPGCSGLTSTSCSLVCGGKFEGAEPVQYFWKKERKGQWKEGNKTISISIIKNTQNFPHYTCKVKNLFSEKESDPRANPFRRPPSGGAGGAGSGGAVLLPAPLLAAILAIGAAVIV